MQNFLSGVSFESSFHYYNKNNKNKSVSNTIRPLANCLLHRNVQQYPNGWPYGWLGMQTGVIYCQWAA